MKLDPIEALAKAHIDGRMGYKITYFSALNTEQKLAYIMERLIDHQKGTLALLEACKVLAQETVEWRKTPEGVAWNEYQANKRAAASTQGK